MFLVQLGYGATHFGATRYPAPHLFGAALSATAVKCCTLAFLHLESFGEKDCSLTQGLFFIVCI